MALLNVLELLSFAGINNGETPQTSCNLLATANSLVIARIGVGGLNLLTLCAVAPLLVRGSIALAFSCLAILLTAAQIALAVLRGN